MDKIISNQVIFLEFGDQTTDTTIIPIELDLEAFIGFKEGIKSRFGPTQQMRFEWSNIDLTLKECQYLKNENKIKYAALSDEEEDDDDFDDEDEEQEETVPKNKIEIPDAIKLACSMVKIGNEKVKEFDKEIVFKGLRKFWDDHAGT